MFNLDPKIVTAIISSIAAIIGAILGAVSKGHSSKQRMKEIALEYEQKLEEGYLENARMYLQDLYIPLSISISKLNEAFYSYRPEKAEDTAQSKFKQSITTFLDDYSQLSKRGANAFLTTDLDDQLQSLSQFLRNSQTSQKTLIASTIGASLRILPIAGNISMQQNIATSNQKAIKALKIAESVNIGGILNVKSMETLHAPIYSEDFEKRFVSDIKEIIVLVKEVTLGASARNTK